MPQTPAKGAKDQNKMEVDSNGSGKRDGMQKTDEDVNMGDREDTTRVNAENAGSSKKKNASFNMAPKESQLVELIINIPLFSMPIPEVIKGIALALGWLAKPKPNNAVKLEKSLGGGLVEPTEKGIPNCWGLLTVFR